jgi:hypothetical protein
MEVKVRIDDFFLGMLVSWQRRSCEVLVNTVVAFLALPSTDLSIQIYTHSTGVMRWDQRAAEI